MIENNNLPVFPVEQPIQFIEEITLPCEAYNNCCHIVQFKA